MIPHVPTAGKSSARPTRLPTDPTGRVFAAAIPARLHGLPWVGWRKEEVPGRDKPAKVPVSPTTGRRAKVSNPRTWGAFPAAVAAVERFDLAGVGVVLTEGSGVIGVDLDDAADPTTGRLDPWAEEIADRLRGTYCEWSPSGAGVRFFVAGAMPDGYRCRANDVEVYDRGRYLTVTGRTLPGRPRRVARCDKGLAWLLDTYLTPRPAPKAMLRESGRSGPIGLADDVLIRRAMAARNGDKFARLWAGDTSGYASASEADLALAALLLFWTAGDTARADSLYRASALARPKWDARRGSTTYGAITLSRAGVGVLGHYSPERPVTPEGLDPPGQEAPHTCVLSVVTPSLGEGLAAAWRRVVEGQPAPGFGIGDPAGRLASLCWHLAGRTPGGSLFLAERDAARLLGLSKTAARKWLGRLEGMGVIRATVRGRRGTATTEGRATEFVWLGLPDPPA